MWTVMVKANLDLDFGKGLAASGIEVGFLVLRGTTFILYA